MVLQMGPAWYYRDPQAYQWVDDREWMRRYYDAQYDVISIDYDEEHEQILKRTKIDGFWSENQDEMLKP